MNIPSCNNNIHIFTSQFNLVRYIPTEDCISIASKYFAKLIRISSEEHKQVLFSGAQTKSQKFSQQIQIWCFFFSFLSFVSRSMHFLFRTFRTSENILFPKYTDWLPLEIDEREKNIYNSKTKTLARFEYATFATKRRRRRKKWILPYDKV